MSSRTLALNAFGSRTTLAAGDRIRERIATDMSGKDRVKRFSVLQSAFKVP